MQYHLQILYQFLIILTILTHALYLTDVYMYILTHCVPGYYSDNCFVKPHPV